MPKSETKETCFIIMPIKTPEPFVENYRDGVEHFEHVLKCLFKPSIKMTEYKLIPPTAKGSDLIHAEIIQNLETSDLVLCDISCLNPNVFFELGIRTALNKPVCIVKDELTNTVPFDTTILNYHEYDSSLESWKLDKEIIKLSDHLKASQERSKGENTLWRHFGFRAKAQPYEEGAGTDAKLDYLNFQMDALRQKIDSIEKVRIPRTLSEAWSRSYDIDKIRTSATLDEETKSSIINKVHAFIMSEFPENTYLLSLSPSHEGVITAVYEGVLLPITRKHIMDTAYTLYGVNLILEPKTPPPSTKKKDDGS